MSGKSGPGLMSLRRGLSFCIYFWVGKQQSVLESGLLFVCVLVLGTVPQPRVRKHTLHY